MVFKKKGILHLLLLSEIFILSGCGSLPYTEQGIVKEEPISEEKQINLTEDTLKETKNTELTEDMLAYWQVLNSKIPFISTDEGYQEFYLNEYFWGLGRVNSWYQVDQFMIVDMDGDGMVEIVLECIPNITQVLHYEDGKVYSYQFGFRGMKRIHTNGIYEGSSSATNTSYWRLKELNAGGYIEEKLAEFDTFLDYYEVEEVEVSHETLSKYVQSIEEVPLVDSIEFTEELLNTYLLGELAEQELLDIKNAPTEEMSEIESNRMENAKALQKYSATLQGEEGIISVTHDNQEIYFNGSYYQDENKDAFAIIYFSIVDMDNDGIDEIVFTCDASVTEILHYDGEKIYSYQFDYNEMGAIAKDGTFQTKKLSDSGYGRIVSFEEDGCKIEQVEVDSDFAHNRIRYYYFSKEVISQYIQ